MMECKKCHNYFSVVFTSKCNPNKIVVVKKCISSGLDLLALGPQFISGTHDRIQLEDSPITKKCTGFEPNMEGLTTIKGIVGHG